MEQNWIMFTPMVYQKSLTDPFTGQPHEILGEK